jgi:subtilisin family serine protease
MNDNTRTIALTLILFAGLGTSALAAEQQPGQQPGQANAVTRAIQSLTLQAGDEALIQAAIANPMNFVAIEGKREFQRELIVHAKKGKVTRANARVAALTTRESTMVPERVISVPQGLDEGQLAAILMATGDYEFVEPNWILYPAVEPNDSQYGSSWQHTRIQSSAAWDIETGSSDVIVAVCDSGVDLDHPDLQDALVPGFNSASNRTQANGGDVDDINGHGTFVAGCAAAQGNNNRGVTGVGWDFSIMPIRVSNNLDGTASLFAILDGARWAAENGAQIINASFSGGTSASNQAAAAYIKQQGGLLFWASGNDNGFVSPNRPDYVLVGSTTSSDNRSGFSNYGPAVDLTAPGSSVRSTRRGGTYGNGSGTSYASPIAAGVGAMIFSTNPELSPDDVQDILYNSVDDLGATGRDDFYGRGRVNTFNAVQMATTYVRPLVMPISSSFEDAAWQSLLVTSVGSPETSSPSDAPEGNAVLRLDRNDMVESVRLAGRSLADDGMLSFALRTEGLEPGESLQVQYLQGPDSSTPGVWTTLGEIDSRGRVGSAFVRFNYTLPDDFLWHGVQVRFVAGGDDTSDAWLIDDLSIDLIPESTAPLSADFESNTIDPVKWTNASNVSVAYDNNSFVAELGDQATLTSSDVPLLQFGFVQPYLRFDAWRSGSVNSSDTLSVEVFTVSGIWETVSTINGADLDTNPELIQINMPIYTWAVDDMKVRFTTSTSGSFFIDDVYLGVEPLSSGCNEADLAEPFGELNFFDVSAFLAAFSANEPDADLNSDGIFNFFDVSSYLSAFSAGCP